MDPSFLNGKIVIDATARILGDVCGLEIDVDSWQTTHMCVNLTDQAIEALGYAKPRFLGKVLVNIPIEVVARVRDVVSLNKSLSEIRSITELRNKKF